MGWRFLASVAVSALWWAPPAAAQPADLPIPAATTTAYPAGISVRNTPKGSVYVDSQGRTLYGLDMRTLARWAPDPTTYCRDRCAGWEPMLAQPGSKPTLVIFRGFQLGHGASGSSAGAGGAPRPAGAPAAQPPADNDGNVLAQVRAAFGEGTAPPGMFTQQHAPDWTIADTPLGPQWVYKGWHLIYVRKGDKPGSTQFDGAEDFTWNTLKFVPPVPTVDGPQGVKPVFVGGAYALADKDGRVLFSGSCTKNCAGWTPLSGGMAAGPIGVWKVSSAGDVPQWTYGGKPIFVSQEDDPKTVPAGGAILRP